MTKNILITGINGFIGLHCYGVFNQKYNIFGLDVFGIEKKNFVLGELDYENLLSFNKSFDAIIHLAGSGSVGMAQRNPEIEYAKTVLSSKHLLDFIINKSPESKLIYVSSAAVYGNCKYSVITEDCQLNPISTYGKHKVMVENFIQEYSQKNDLKYDIIRPFSVYGNNLKKQVLWDFCNKIKDNFNNSEILCFGTGEEERDFINVSDLVNCIELLMNDNKYGRIFNVGTGIATSINTIFTTLTSLFNYKGKLVYNMEESKNNPKALVANIDKLSAIGFKPQIGIQEGLENYAKWFKEQN
ncbi:NAD(P)-dependent oxidoreductase [bacterium]|nr:NAD(P)-dependent oxidoreductase [bacterium]